MRFLYGVCILLSLFMLIDTLKMWNIIPYETVAEVRVYDLEEKILLDTIDITLLEDDLDFDYTEVPQKPIVIKSSLTDVDGLKVVAFKDLDLYRQKVDIKAEGREKAYIKRFLPTALVDQQKFGIPASIKLAQGIKESNRGASTLATKVNNHFGIKTSSESGYNLYDDDPNDKFQRFSTAWESFRRHSYVMKNDRYKAIFASEFNREAFNKYRNLKGCYNCKSKVRVVDNKFDEKLKLLEDNWNIPYKRFAYGLDIVGYATDNNYAKDLIDLIEKNELYKFDNIEVIL